MAVAGGRSDSIHRGARRILDDRRQCGSQLRQWLTSTLPLSDYPAAFCSLRALACISLVERRVESIHAIIKRIGQSSTTVLPPYACARVREESNLELLRCSSEFHQCCMLKRRQRDFFDGLLRPRFSKARLTRMSQRKKTFAVYQCDLEYEHADTTIACAQQAVFANATPAMMNIPSSVGEECKQVAYFALQLFRDAIFVLCHGHCLICWLRLACLL